MAMKQSMQLLTSTATEEWYTPPDPYVDLVRLTLGEIELDPASNTLAQTWIRAKVFYTIEDDGLLQDWAGMTYLNPPYGLTQGKKGDSNQAIWSQRLEREHLNGSVPAAVLLVNSAHGYGWYERLWSRWWSCCLRERIRFINADGKQGAQAKRGQTIIYFGQEYERFAELWRPLGRVLPPERTLR